MLKNEIKSIIVGHIVPEIQLFKDGAYFPKSVAVLPLQRTSDNVVRRAALIPGILLVALH